MKATKKSTKKSPVSFQAIENSLNSILESLDDLPFINSGGCGVSALAIYRWCKAHDVWVSDRPFTFLWRDGNEWEASNNDELLLNGELDRVEAPSHVVIQLFDGGDYDSTGQRCDCYPYVVRQEYKLNEQELLNVINRPEEWNSVFQRALLIERIEFSLGIDLSDIVR